jgi:2-oxo-3-hexenedioate decarboxylase
MTRIETHPGVDPASPALTAIAAEALAALGSGRQVAPFTSRFGRLTLPDSYRVLPLLRAGFEARGETMVGRKIGFTNRTIWAQYGVYAPIWGYVTDATSHDLNAAEVSLARFAEPRIEPEIIFGLARAPSPGMDDAAILDCVSWVALGYEIVVSIYPGWRFAAPDTVAGNGLHGALLIGPRHDVAANKSEWLRTLSAFTVDLARDGELIERGSGANVLEGPLSTIRHLMTLLAGDPYNPALGAGEIISTGTLTRAYPVKPGESWTAMPHGIALGEIGVRFA